MEALYGSGSREGGGRVGFTGARPLLGVGPPPVFLIRHAFFGTPRRYWLAEQYRYRYTGNCVFLPVIVL